MVKEIGKRKKGTFRYLPDIKKLRNVSELRQSKSELIILSILKRKKTVGPSYLTEILNENHTDCEKICKKMMVNKLIKKQKTSKKSFVYQPTIQGLELINNLLEYTKDPKTQKLAHLALFRKIYHQFAYPDVEY